MMSRRPSLHVCCVWYSRFVFFYRSPPSILPYREKIPARWLPDSIRVNRHAGCPCNQGCVWRSPLFTACLNISDWPVGKLTKEENVVSETVRQFKAAFCFCKGHMYAQAFQNKSPFGPVWGEDHHVVTIFHHHHLSTTRRRRALIRTI